MQLDDVKKFLKQNFIASLGTVSESGQPDVSIIYYTYDGSHSLYFATPTDSRKMANIQSNERVSLAISRLESFQELQIEGKAYLIKGEDEETMILNSLHQAVKEHHPAEWPIFDLRPEDLSVVCVVLNKFKFSSFGDEPQVFKESFSE